MPVACINLAFIQDPCSIPSPTSSHPARHHSSETRLPRCQNIKISKVVSKSCRLSVVLDGFSPTRFWLVSEPRCRNINRLTQSETGDTDGFIQEVQFCLLVREVSRITFFWTEKTLSKRCFLGHFHNDVVKEPPKRVTCSKSVKCGKQGRFALASKKTWTEPEWWFFQILFCHLGFRDQTADRCNGASHIFVFFCHDPLSRHLWKLWTSGMLRINQFWSDCQRIYPLVKHGNGNNGPNLKMYSLLKITENVGPFSIFSMLGTPEFSPRLHSKHFVCFRAIDFPVAHEKGPRPTLSKKPNGSVLANCKQNMFFWGGQCIHSTIPKLIHHL